MLQNLTVSFASFARRTKERLDETVTATQGAMKAAHAQRQDSGASLEVEVSRMGELIAVLESAKTDFDDFRTGLSPVGKL
jgi:phage-related tail protein